MASPTLIRPSVLATVTAGRDFTWPEFDRWQAFFTAADTFPDRWDGLHAAPPPRAPEAADYRQRKLALFAEWLELLSRRPATFAHYARQGIRPRIARQHAGPSCPACDPFDASVVGSDLDPMPPFHPGCRCVLVAVPATPAFRHPRGYERARPSAG
jgi:hypothetical protein